MRLFLYYQLKDGRWAQYIGSPVITFTGQVTMLLEDKTKINIHRDLVKIHTGRDNLPKQVNNG